LYGAAKDYPITPDNPDNNVLKMVIDAIIGKDKMDPNTDKQTVIEAMRHSIAERIRDEPKWTDERLAFLNNAAKEVKTRFNGDKDSMIAFWVQYADYKGDVTKISDSDKLPEKLVDSLTIIKEIIVDAKKEGGLWNIYMNLLTAPGDDFTDDMKNEYRQDLYNYYTSTSGPTPYTVDLEFMIVKDLLSNNNIELISTYLPDKGIKTTDGKIILYVYKSQSTNIDHYKYFRLK
jgi:hypothetical protein